LPWKRTDRTSIQSVCVLPFSRLRIARWALAAQCGFGRELQWKPPMLDAAGLTAELQAEGPLTVFAPTEAAFAALPEGALASLLQPENQQQLRELLLLHVVPGRLTGMEVANIEEPQFARTAVGTRLPVAADRRGLRFADANVVSHGEPCTNGLLYAIDRVLTPPSAPHCSTRRTATAWANCSRGARCPSSSRGASSSTTASAAR
jgi:hypothetical protein